MNKQFISPRLGTWCDVPNYAFKHRDRDRITWLKVDTKPARGMYIGRRYKRNGHVKEAGEWPETERWFVPEGTVEVWLFVFNENRNPLEVFPFPVLPRQKAVV